MKTKLLFLITVCLMTALQTQAYDFFHEGVYYNILSTTDHTVEVTRSDVAGSYEGSIVIPSTLELIAGETYTVISIENSAFSSCDSLRSVSIPKSVSTIENRTFSSCTALESIHVDTANTSFMSEDGILFNHDQTSLIQYPCQRSGSSYTIPNSVLYLGWFSFKYCQLTEVTIPNSVTYIDYGAFVECRALRSITIPNSTDTIGHIMFTECSALTSISIPQSVSFIGKGAFRGCSSLANIYIDNPTPSNIGLGAGIFTYMPDSTCILHVPAGSEMLYSVANQWSAFINITAIVDPSACPDVTGIRENGIDEYNTYIYWEQDEKVESVDAILVTMDWDERNKEITMLNNIDNPFYISGLDPDHIYELYLRNVCVNDSAERRVGDFTKMDGFLITKLPVEYYEEDSTTIYYVSDKQFEGQSPVSKLVGNDTVVSEYGIETFVHNYAQFHYKEEVYSDTLFVSDTTFICDTTFITDYKTYYDTVSVSDTLIIDVEFTAGLITPYVIQARVYPNPAKDKIYIDLEKYEAYMLKDSKVKLIDLIGNTIQSLDINAPQLEMDISGINEAGVYFLQVTDWEGQVLISRKILIK